MKKIKAPIIITTAYVVVYQSAPYIGIPIAIIIAMFLISPLVVGWTVYKILKNGEYKSKPLGNKEFGYEDYDPYKE